MNNRIKLEIDYFIAGPETSWQRGEYRNKTQNA